VNTTTNVSQNGEPGDVLALGHAIVQAKLAEAAEREKLYVVYRPLSRRAWAIVSHYSAGRFLLTRAPQLLDILLKAFVGEAAELLMNDQVRELIPKLQAVLPEVETKILDEAGRIKRARFAVIERFERDAIKSRMMFLFALTVRDVVGVERGVQIIEEVIKAPQSQRVALLEQKVEGIRGHRLAADFFRLTAHGDRYNWLLATKAWLQESNSIGEQGDAPLTLEEAMDLLGPRNLSRQNIR
jgi:hypothetical protein